ncbi:hypothetical protein V6N12_074692 [Hibiscus sabdariffa]|uniref:Uncharacterized protein n=1 Tax=Hibiscus sabdariffa TaxID=183260 RepID=A0ABR2BYA4_9ROSI
MHLMIGDGKKKNTIFISISVLLASSNLCVFCSRHVESVRKALKVFWFLSFYCLVWSIWLCRNDVIFNNTLYNDKKIYEAALLSHDLVTAAEVNVSDLIREVVTEYRVDFDANLVTMVIDHTDYAVSEIEGEHTMIASNDSIVRDLTEKLPKSCY